jgi:uncharacterized membrane protein YqiK
MTSNSIQFAFIVAVIVVAAFVTIGIILAKLYQRATKEVAFVRTGFGGQKVIMNGGALVFPVLHEVIEVNMNTLRLEVQRKNEAALITKDRMRVDILAEFYVRVKPTEEAIADAAQTLGKKTMNPASLKELVEGKFVDALRAVGSEMAMEELHEQRGDFVQKVQKTVSEDLLKNGLELETVSLTGLDQTSKDFFNPNNAFDAQGLTKLTEEIEARKKQRNDIEKDTDVQIKEKNLETERKKLTIEKEEEYAKLEQEREVEIRRASQSAEIAAEKAGKLRESKEAEIAAKRQTDQAEIEAEKAVAEKKIIKEKAVQEQEILKMKAIELAEQDRHIAIAEKSKEESLAKAEAAKAKAEAAKQEEKIVTAKEAEVAERAKIIELIEASQSAEKKAIEITVAAETERKSSEDKAKAIKTIAQAEADALVIKTQAEQKRYEVEANGQMALNKAANSLSDQQVAMQIKLTLLENLDKIIAESVKPIEQIDGIKIVSVEGLGVNPAGAQSATCGEGVPASNGNLAEQVISGALKYRAQAPLIDSLLKDVGIDGGSLHKLGADLADFGPIEEPEPKAKPQPKKPNKA